MVCIFKWLIGTGILFGCMVKAPAQELQDFLSKYTRANGMDYMQPFADVFGANVNTGWFHSANIKKMEPQIYIGAVGMIAMVPKKKKTFIATPEGLFTPKTPVAVPTLFGNGASVTLEGEGGTSYTFPGGVDVSAVSLVAPQVDIGALLGTQVSVRFFIHDFGGEIGKSNMFGMGVRHSISQYIPSLPAQLAIGYYWTSFQIGDITDAKNSFISLQGSYSLQKLTFYGGLGIERTSMQIGYTFEGEEGMPEDINFDLNGENTLRFTMGVSLKISVFRLNADYNLSGQDVFSLGLGFDIVKK